MKHIFGYVADAFDIIAALCAAGAAWFFLASVVSVESGPAFLQLGLLALVIAVVPYCFAGALHRIWRRL